MTFEEIIAKMQAVKRHLDDRVEVWRVVIGPATGRETTRIYRGSFRRGVVQPPDDTRRNEQ